MVTVKEPKSKKVPEDPNKVEYAVLQLPPATSAPVKPTETQGNYCLLVCMYVCTCMYVCMYVCICGGGGRVVKWFGSWAHDPWVMGSSPTTRR